MNSEILKTSMVTIGQLNYEHMKAIDSVID